MYKRKRKYNSRGYLGPIGDDIPSLIPIIVGLITFFSAFTFTLNEYNQRSAGFAADRDTLIIANSLKGDSYLSVASEFTNACTGLRVRGLNYVAVVIDSAQWNALLNEAKGNPDVPQLGFLANYVFSLNNIPLACSNELTIPFTSTELADVLSNNPYVVLSMPIALELTTAVVPGTLVVMTWRG